MVQFCMNLSMSLSIPFKKSSLLIRLYDFVLPVYPCRSYEFISMVGIRDYGIINASKLLSPSWVSL